MKVQDCRQQPVYHSRWNTAPLAECGAGADAEELPRNSGEMTEGEATRARAGPHAGALAASRRPTAASEAGIAAHRRRTAATNVSAVMKTLTTASALQTIAPACLITVCVGSWSCVRPGVSGEFNLWA